MRYDIQPTACYCYSKIGFSGEQFDGHWNNLLQMRYVDLCVMFEEMMIAKLKCSRTRRYFI
eukprot:scaffold37590_cov155-Skeletonema_dohrnii-CCMP3373.AAC.2